MEKQLSDIYGGKVRVRVCGICRNDEQLLMVNHSSITAGNFWAPPGGGIDFGCSIEETLKKEFDQETGLTIAPGKFLFGCEIIKDPIHAIELFYEVKIKSGNLRTGYDPEIQIIKDVRFLSSEEIMKIPAEELHGIFRHVGSVAELSRLSGFFRI